MPAARAAAMTPAVDVRHEAQRDDFAERVIRLQRGDRADGIEPRRVEIENNQPRLLRAGLAQHVLDERANDSSMPICLAAVAMREENIRSSTAATIEFI